MKKKKGFTLVELLAVIVILAIILVIAVPKISDTIINSKKSSLATSAKLVAVQAEKKYTEYQVLGDNDTIECSDIAKLSDNDYDTCNVSFDDKGNAKVTIIGKGKFEGLAVCDATKNSATVTDSCNINYFRYIDTTGGISITGYNIEGGTDIVIPESIDGKTVVAIADYAFTNKNTIYNTTASNNDYKVSLLNYNGNKYEVRKMYNVVTKGIGITSVVIPKTVTKIGKEAFAANKITSITFPDTPITLDCDVFTGNPIITSGTYTFPTNVTISCTSGA